MDRLIISGTGFPGAIEHLQFQDETSALFFEALAKAVGNNVIFNGIIDNDGLVSSGWLIYGNEILPFKESAIGETVVIKEIITTAAYDNTQGGNFDQIAPVWKKRYCEFGDPNDADVVANFPFADLTRIDTLQVLSGISQATEAVKGIAEIATQAEANGTEDDQRIITAKKLTARNATTSRRGVVELATVAEVIAGSDNERAVTPKGLKDSGYKIQKVTFGNALTENRASGFFQNDFTKNFKKLYPPAGYNMSNLVGFIASMSEIYPSGDVDNNDIFFCKYELRADHIIVICQSKENRENSRFNYKATWQK